MKAGTQNHIKLKRLKKLLNLPLYRVVGILETLWLLCSDCCDEGGIGKYTDEEIGDYLEWDGPDASGLVRALLESGWLDHDTEKRLVIHDWLDHCPEYIKDRIRKREWRAAKGKKSNEITTCESSEPDTAGHNRTQEGPAAATTVYSQPNPTQPIQTPPPPNQSATLEEEVRAFGVGQARKAIEAARLNGCPDDQIRCYLRHVRENAASWDDGPGVLVAALKVIRPGDSPPAQLAKGKAVPKSDHQRKISKEQSVLQQRKRLRLTLQHQGVEETEILRQCQQIV